MPPLLAPGGFLHPRVDRHPRLGRGALHRRRRQAGPRQHHGAVGEVEAAGMARASEEEDGGVVGHRRGLRGGVGAEPQAVARPRHADLRHPLAPSPAAHALVLRLASFLAVTHGTGRSETASCGVRRSTGGL